MIGWRVDGDFSNTKNYFKRLLDRLQFHTLEEYGRRGVDALSKATPIDTGLTAASWHYAIERSSDKATISFYNTNIQNGVPIAIILQYGHVTGSGGWVEGRDYINPSLRPIFDSLAESAWRDITNL